LIMSFSLLLVDIKNDMISLNLKDTQISTSFFSSLVLQQKKHHLGFVKHE